MRTEGLAASSGIVTGAARGIGRAVTLALANRGATVVCTARTARASQGTLPGSLEETAAAAAELPGHVVTVPCDMSDPDAVDRLAIVVNETMPRFDFVFHAAFSRVTAPASAFSLSDWRESVTANLDAVFQITRLALDHFGEGGGSLVFVTSAMASPDASLPLGYAGYAAAKAAIERFAIALATEVADRGVAVNTFSTGTRSNGNGRGGIGHQP